MSGPPAQPAGRVELRQERDVAAARIAVSKAMDALNARALRKTRFVTAVSEIARNALDHGGGGVLEIYRLDRPRRIMIRCSDQGPGIADIDQAMTDGFSTARSMGKGLGGARRLVDAFRIESRVGAGTTIEMEANP
ncbi:serine/threonine-protein kinase RsbT [Limimaricola soesokkakensis]|uniref:Serine/threonine-protein kinase RsbT n=1 Tax=Limimaricola soesokkakensis TaxID=1343159 RepID=A0A1X6YBA5_9RHOB|nr:ATP-binding protein [Limimaricola soesokkakensis]PSK87112.1 serine/threonine-protein kinase RsbT [Limimaricola soesokkakensis]SLN16464.1 Serine/threonine-protein kinase RsbT [Limimaricola soesokkakensis]